MWRVYSWSLSKNNSPIDVVVNMDVWKSKIFWNHRIRGIIGLEYTLQNWLSGIIFASFTRMFLYGLMVPFWNQWLPFQFTCFYISSPEPKALVSFSDQNLSVVCVVIVVVVRGGTIHRRDRCTDASWYLILRYTDRYT